MSIREVHPAGRRPLDRSVGPGPATPASELLPDRMDLRRPPAPDAGLRQACDGFDLWPGRSCIQEAAPNLCITNVFGARKLAQLQQARISHVVICADELPEAFPNHFAYLKLTGLVDNTGTPLLPYLRKALPWIKDAQDRGGRVLLHCASGSSRSGAVLIAYLMWQQDLTVDQALALARRSRPIIAPNPGFYEQLEASQSFLRGAL